MCHHQLQYFLKKPSSAFGHFSQSEVYEHAVLFLLRCQQVQNKLCGYVSCPNLACHKPK
jgi:hypothetical protein